MNVNPLNIIITGGSSGIGKALVCRFANAGHRVLTTYYSNEESVASIKRQYRNVDACHLDQGNLDSVETFTESVRNWLNLDLPLEVDTRRTVDVLINNAALGSATVIPYIQDKYNREAPANSKTFEELSDLRKKALEDEALMKVNALGPLWVTESLMPLMTKSVNSTNARARSYSTVLFLGSVGGSTGVFPEYRASDLMSKSAVTYLSKHLAAEHIHSNIDVFCYAPGATDTEMFRKSTLEKCSNPTAFMNSMPKQRLLDPEEIADSIYALCTEKWARIFHGGVLDASLGLGTRPGLQTETTAMRQFIYFDGGSNCTGRPTIGTYGSFTPLGCTMLRSNTSQYRQCNGTHFVVSTCTDNQCSVSCTETSSVPLNTCEDGATFRSCQPITEALIPANALLKLEWEQPGSCNQSDFSSIFIYHEDNECFQTNSTTNAEYFEFFCNSTSGELTKYYHASTWCDDPVGHEQISGDQICLTTQNDQYSSNTLIGCSISQMLKGLSGPPASAPVSSPTHSPSQTSPIASAPRANNQPPQTSSSSAVTLPAMTLVFALVFV